MLRKRRWRRRMLQKSNVSFPHSVYTLGGLVIGPPPPPQYHHLPPPPHHHSQHHPRPPPWHHHPQHGHPPPHPGIVRGQMDIINICHVKNPCVPMRCAVKIIPNNKSCSNSFQWLCHFFRMAHRDETTKCYLRQERAFTQYCVLQSLYKHVPVLPFTTKLAQTRGFAASPIDTATCAQQNTRGFAAFPIDTATPEDKQKLETTWAQQNKRGFAASTIDTATPEDKQKLETRLKFCSFPQRHGDVSAAKQAKLGSFPHSHGDARG